MARNLHMGRTYRYLINLVSNDCGIKSKSLENIPNEISPTLNDAPPQIKEKECNSVPIQDKAEQIIKGSHAIQLGVVKEKIYKMLEEKRAITIELAKLQEEHNQLQKQYEKIENPQVCEENTNILRHRDMLYESVELEERLNGKLKVYAYIEQFSGGKAEAKQ